MPDLSDQGFLDLGDQRLEYRMAGPRPNEAPTLILLHEGLGSAGMWGDFPEKLSAATGCGVFVYSRQGYGWSSAAKLPRTLDFMHVEARETLPRLLDAIGLRQGLLVGLRHGASPVATWLRPAALARYNARSAATSTSSSFLSVRYSATPMLAVTSPAR